MTKDLDDGDVIAELYDYEDAILTARMSDGVLDGTTAIVLEDRLAG